MAEFLAALVIVAGFLTGYIVSRYASMVFVDPDEIDTFYPKASPSQRAFMRRLADDPRALMQVADAYKAFVLILVSGLSLRLVSTAVAYLGVAAYLGYAVGFVFIWVLYLAVVEALPRYYSRKAVRRTMLRYLWLVHLVYLVFVPVVRVYRRSLKRSMAEEPVTEEEKEEIVERALETVADHAGIVDTIVDDEEREMISQIFLLDQKVVREIMIPRIDIVAVEKNMSFKSIRKLVHEDGHSRYPVYEETIDKILGLLYVKDLFSNMPEAGEKFVITDYLRKPYFVPETKIIGELLREFKDKRQHIAMVADEYGGVAGVVTLEDIIEEIFGEIQDEHDSEAAEFSDMGDGRFVVSAALMVDKLQDYLDTEYEQGDYDTVGGLIYDLVGSVPGEGQVVRWHDLELQVDKVEGQRIRQVVVRRKAPS
ncbi:MAG: HlyC/CorC family transporter [Candidatus Zixiibacteriota bacterium]|nr:MAG: HlyC/CorC family transporter [candidate division Zixibacteria bacterium]